MPESIAGQKVIERLYQGNRWDVYRVQMPSGDTAIAKVSCEEFPSAEALVRLRAEYDTLTRLRDVAGVVQVLGLERDRQGLALMLADGGGLPLSKILAAERLSLRDALVVGIQTAAILSRIHSQTLIHKDINPSNILWNRDTGTVEIIDFELATTHASERQVVISPTSLDGTLAYMAPEQTGRMNRSIDYRSDLYALGVSLYQIFTGGLPFVTRDAMELVHSHLAKLPDSPTDRDATIPKVISEIVLRLMAKTAEERYQSALGVQRDLEQALAQLDQTGSIASFALGTKDRPHGLRVSQTLYGREAEVKLLVNSVETAGSGPAELIMVGGYSGVGKTALLEELHKPVAQRRGYFISGKFDQFQRHIPHTAIIQAFRALVSQLLTEPETDVLLWGEALTSALGELGQVLVDLIPEFEIILGPQPPIVALDGADAEARLHTVIASLLDALCTAEHPMALFLDDLQWADPASLKLLRHLATETKHRHLVLLGAYRDNEVSPEHPLMLTLAAIAEQRPYRALELEPLSADWTNALVADSLDAAPEITQPLADAVYAKTLGNPFFVSRLLQSIYENGLLVWDVERRGWSWDLPAIQSLAFSDNVVDLMVAKINQLPDLTRSLLQQASCLGASFALDALTDICDVARSMTAASLDFAVQADLLRLEGASGRLRSWPVGQDKAEEEDATSSPSGVTLFFVHDRIQEAAYSQLSVAQRQAIHWRAGVTLLRSLSEPERLKALFPLVNHLNQGWSEGADGPTAVDLAELNLEAGLRAMASVAHATALDYIRQGIAYLGPVGWDSHHHLMFDLHRALAKAEFQCGHHDATEAVIAELNSRAIGRTQKASLHAFMLEVSLTRGRWADGLAVGLECLTLFGFDLPQEEAALDAALAAEQAAIDALLAGRDIAALADAPLMQDPDKIQVLELLHRTWTCAYMVNYKLGTLAVLKVVRLSLDHGNAPFSAFGYIVYGSILSSVHNEYQKAYEFGLLALNLNERFGVVELVPKVNNMFAHTINHFAKPLASNIPIYEESYQASLACGDLWWGVWAVDFLVGNQFIKGDALDKVHETSLRYQGYVEKSGDAALLHMMRLNQHVVLNLRGLTPDAISLTGPDWDVDKALAELRALPFDFGVFWIRLSQSILHLLYGDLERAAAASAEAEALKANAPGFMLVMEQAFYRGQILAEICEADPEDRSGAPRQELNALVAQMQRWSVNAPFNYGHKHSLLLAEVNRLDGLTGEAAGHYDAAIEAALDNGFIQIAALGNELAAKFYLKTGRSVAAWGYLMKARSLYSMWGAGRKVRLLEETHSDLFRRVGATVLEDGTIRSSKTSELSELDLRSIIKASQAISGEITVKPLLERLMRLVLETGGAQQAVLLLQRDGHLVAEARGTAEPDVIEILDGQPVFDAKDHGLGAPLVPLSVLRLAESKRDALVLDDARTDLMFRDDPYFAAVQPRSIFCLPILRHGAVSGILYLENNLSPGAFTADRRGVLRLLASQAAISIENAYLYLDMEDRVAARTRELSLEIQERKRVEGQLREAKAELEATNARLARIAVTDKLTNLFNRVKLDEVLYEQFETSRRFGHPLSLIIVDIDHFKQVNDLHGHQIGDAILVAFASILRNNVRKVDIAGRWGGEEFMIACLQCAGDTAAKVAEKLRQRVAETDFPHVGQMTASFGVASLAAGDSIESLVQRADQALYRAKLKGRNRVETAAE